MNVMYLKINISGFIYNIINEKLELKKEIANMKIEINIIFIIYQLLIIIILNHIPDHILSILNIIYI